MSRLACKRLKFSNRELAQAIRRLASTLVITTIRNHDQPDDGTEAGFHTRSHITPDAPGSALAAIMMAICMFTPFCWCCGGYAIIAWLVVYIAACLALA
jgi:hypothetical protein